MNMKFPETNDRLEVVADSTGTGTNEGGQYIIAKWGKPRAQNLSKTVKDLRDKGKRVKRFYGDKAYDADEVYRTGVEVVVPPRKDASTRRGHPARL